MDNWRGALKQIYRLPEGRNTVRRNPSMRTELRRSLHWKEEGALVMRHKWEGKRKRARYVANPPVKREFSERGNLPARELQLTTRRKDSECNRKVKGATTLSKISGGEIYGDSACWPGES